MLYLAVRLFGRRVESRIYEAFIIYNEKKNQIISVPRYAFSEGICRYIRGAFAENPALRTLWEKEPLKGLFSVDLDGFVPHPRLIPFFIFIYHNSYSVS